MKFTHLHAHSHYSLLSALPKVDELVLAAKREGMTALALTDNGNLYGAIEFYKTCKQAGLKPILGVDAYVAARSRFDKQAGIDNRRTRLVLLAKNLSGYKNLIKLVTASHLEGFYYKPRVDRELLQKYAEGLIAVSPAINGIVSATLKNGDPEAAAEIAEWHKKIFGVDNFFLEITRHGEIAGHEKNMAALKSFSEKTKTPLVAGHEVYYLSPEDKKARDTLTLVNSNAELGDRSFGAADAGDFSFISSEAALALFKDLPEALRNNEKITEECNLSLPLGKWVFPDYKPEAGKTLDEELRALAYKGLALRGLPKTTETLERIEYELKVIKDKGYAPYFLVVSDLLRHARERKILSTTRGSAAGSLVSFLTYITTVNPIEYKLPFNRFLNPERPSAPDIDMDIADNRRDEMIEYAREKYGADRVAQIGTFGTMMARGSVRDVSRALGHPYSLGDRVAKLIPMGSQGFPMSIDRAMEMAPELKKIYREEKEVAEVIDLAKKIEGCARHISVHAAGVVIAPSPLTDFTPLQFDPKGEGKIITQYDMYVMEDVGLLKLDFLGIKNLSILADSVALAKKLEGAEIDIENIPLGDKKTFEMLSRGETGGLFQLNGSGMTRYLKDLRPTSIHDINAMVALYRPGPMESIPEYIRRKHNPALLSYLDPRLKTILDQSYGVITYQDDVLEIAVQLGGYSWLLADKLRKAMGKKIPAEMEEQKEKLTAGFIKNGMTKEKAEKMWTLIEPFAAYGFNRCIIGDTKIMDGYTGRVWTVNELCKTSDRPLISTLTEAQKIETEPLVNIHQNGVKQVYTLTTRTGKRITTTLNHPFLTMRGWKTLEKLLVGERIATARRLPPPKCSKPIEFYKSAVLGYLIAEGNLCHPHGIYFYSAQEDEVADFKALALKFPNVKIKIDKSKSATSVYCGQINPKHGNSIRIWIEQLGIKNKKATAKEIPAEVFLWEQEAIATLLGKMWQGDGCVAIERLQLYYATSSEHLASQVQHMLLRFSIISTVHKKNFKYRGGWKSGYTVTITHRDNILQFAATIGCHLIGEKFRRLNILCSLSENARNKKLHAARGTKDIIPASILPIIISEMTEQKVRVKEMSFATGLAERLFNYDIKKVGYQRSVINAIGTELDCKILIHCANSDIYWDEVVKISPAGKEMTYDLTLPPHHNFVANDIIVHNSHAASYGKVAYQTAYMKANFPAIYMSAVLTADSGDVEKIAEIIGECKRMAIEVLPPSINESFSGFTVVKPQPNPKSEIRNPKQIQNYKPEKPDGGKDRIRFGLTTIKNFGEGLADAIIAERERGGTFRSIGDFLGRVKNRNLNKKSLEALVKSGAMDEFGERGAMLSAMDLMLSYAKEMANAPENQVSLFGETAVSRDDFLLPEAAAATESNKLLWEKELLGLYVSGHPLDKFKNILEKRETTVARVKAEMKEGMMAVVGGIIEEVRPIFTKNNEQMAFVRLADLSGGIEIVFFPRVFQEFQKFIVAEKCLAVRGRISNRNDEVSIIAEKVKELA